MTEKKNEKKGCGCGCDFNKEVNSMVKEAQKPTAEQHKTRKEEVEKAFEQKDNKRK